MTTRLVWLCLTLAAPSLAVQQAPSTAPGLIVGRVVDALSRQPLASARVRLARSGGQPFAAVLTGPDGRFAFSQVRTGSTFTIAVSRAGYLEGRYGQKRPAGTPVRLVLDDGERRGDLEVLMWPAASIAGTVFGEGSTPLPGAPVFARRLMPGGAPDPADLRGTGTVSDRQGNYRIDGLPPGEYVVSVYCSTTTAPVVTSEASMPVAPGVFEFPTQPGDPTIYVQPDGERFSTTEGPLTGVPRLTYVTTFHGGATLVSKATPVQLGAGDDRVSIDITLVNRPAIDVSGTVIGLEPTRRAVVRLLPADQDELTIDEDAVAAATVITDPSGRFTMYAVPAGDYLLDAYVMSRIPRVDVSTTGVPTLRSLLTPRYTRGGWARMPVSFGDQDVVGVTPRLRAGVTVRGVLQYAAVPPQTGSVTRGTVGLGDRYQRIAAMQSEAFELTHVRPGLQDLTVQGLPSRWGLISALVDGREVAGIGLNVGNEDIDGVTMTVGPQAELEGQVTDEGRPAADATVVVFPTDSTMWRIWRTANTRMRTLRTSTGSFTFAGIPPGEYFVVAVDDAALDRWPAPDFLRRLSTTAARLTMSAGQRQARALILDRSIR